VVMISRCSTLWVRKYLSSRRLLWLIRALFLLAIDFVNSVEDLIVFMFEVLAGAVSNISHDDLT
jgi:hypothetical protein